MKIYHLSLVSILILLPINSFCLFEELNFESFKYCLQRHQEAFKNFEGEASQVQVSTSGKALGHGYIQFTKHYSPVIPHLEEYLFAVKKLMAKIKTNAMIKGIALGTILGFAHSILLAEVSPSIKKANSYLNVKTRLFLMFIMPLIGSLGLILHENKSIKSPEPYFDIWSLKRNSNIFAMDLYTIIRVLLAFENSIGAEFASLFVFYCLFDGITNKQVNKV